MTVRAATMWRGYVAGVEKVWFAPAADPVGVTNKRAMAGNGKHGRRLLSRYRFTALAAGGLATAAFTGSMSFARASAGAVQTGTGSIVVGLANNTAGIGRSDDGHNLGLAVNESRTNIPITNRGFDGAGWLASSGGTQTPNYAGVPDPTGGTTLSTRYQIAAFLNYSKYWQTAAIMVAHTFSIFMRGTSGSYTNVQITQLGHPVGVITSSLTTAWARYVNTISFAVPTVTYLTPADGFDAAATYPIDVCGDFPQIEQGLFATDPIVTAGAAVTRAGERPYLPSLQPVDDVGRVTLDIVFRPMGGTYDFTADMMVWVHSSGDYCKVDFVAGTVVVHINGVDVTLGVLPFAAYDLVELYIAAGGSALATTGTYRINGGAAVSLGAGAVQDPVSLAGTMNYFSDGAAAGQLSARIEQIDAFPGGQ